MSNYSGVRISHIPTGIVVECSAYRTVEENREGALRILRAKLYEIEHPSLPISVQSVTLAATLYNGGWGKPSRVRDSDLE